MIVQYEVRESELLQYRDAIKEIVDALPKFGAEEIKVSQFDSSSNQITEIYTLPTESHYFALKNFRKSKTHNVFGCLDSFIAGGLNEIACFALKKPL